MKEAPEPTQHEHLSLEHSWIGSVLQKKDRGAMMKEIGIVPVCKEFTNR